MKRRLAIFHDRYPLIGPVFWILGIQYFVTQVVVAAGWHAPFSLRHNTISDLGNTACGIYGHMYVCSPLHNLMNASFITLGIFIVAGSALIHQEFRKTSGSALGFTCMALAGIGTLIVGLMPENTVAALHVLGAVLPFVLGNVAMVVLGSVLKLSRQLRMLTVGLGLVGLSALGLFLTHTYGPIGRGGMERVVAYPQTIWMILFGLYMSRNHYLRRRLTADKK